MTKTYTPHILLRGDRNYVHSPEIYNSILEGAQECGFGIINGPIQINLRALARNQLRYVFQEAETKQDRLPRAVLDFSIEIDERKISGWAEETDEEVSERRTYDESPIHTAASLDGDAVTISKPTPYSSFEVMASICVLLHRTVAPPPKGLKWLASRYDLTRPLETTDAAGMEVRLVHRLGNKMTKSVIVASGEPLGHTFFSLGSPTITH